MEHRHENIMEHEGKVGIGIISPRSGRALDMEFGDPNFTSVLLGSLVSLGTLLTFWGVSHQCREAHTGMR